MSYLDKLVGGVIESAGIDEGLFEFMEDGEDGVPALIIRMPDGTCKLIYVYHDAEANGPGFLDIMDIS